jgi:uncharacterized membrane protein
MGKGRLEAFSDGVLAIILTIMVLDLRAPSGIDLTSLKPLVPVFISYVLSFVFIGIYWNNHHHMLHAVSQVNGTILWANLQLLFWLSLIPFVTSWMGKHFFSPWPVALYGVVLLAASIAYYILSRELIRHHGKNSALATAVGKDTKGIVSAVIYFTAIPLSFVFPWLSYGLYVLVAIIWIVPDRRIEKTLKNK